MRRHGQNAVVFGLKGSGKTTLTRRLLVDHRRVLIVDPQREYRQVAVEVGSMQELADYLERTDGRWRIAYFSTQLEQDFPLLCAAAWSIGNLLFVVEEVDRFCEPAWIPQELFQIVNYGRHAPAGSVDYLAVSRRPADVHRALTSQAYEIYCFTIGEPRDVEYLSKLVARDFAEGLPALRPHHFRFMDLYDRSKGWRDVGPGPLPAGTGDREPQEPPEREPAEEADGGEL